MGILNGNITCNSGSKINQYPQLRNQNSVRMNSPNRLN